jgi:hypothetical protein
MVVFELFQLLLFIFKHDSLSKLLV